MVKAKSFQEFTRTADRYGRGISNDFMLPGAAEKLIRHGKLYYEATDEALLVFEERTEYMKLTFRVRDGRFRIGSVMAAPACSRVSEAAGSVRPPRLAAFTVGRGTPGRADEWLAANGFALKQERVRYTAAKLNVQNKPLANGPSGGVLKSAAGEAFTKPLADSCEIVGASVAYPIYRRCFDMLIADLPDPELFYGALCVRNKAGEAIGVLSLGADRHIGVLPEYRGQGVAMRLYAMLAAREPDLGTQRLFADADNPASNGLYKKLGFKTDGIILRCYINGNESK